MSKCGEEEVKLINSEVDLTFLVPAHASLSLSTFYDSPIHPGNHHQHCASDILAGMDFILSLIDQKIEKLVKSEVN